VTLHVVLANTMHLTVMLKLWRNEL